LLTYVVVRRLFLLFCLHFFCLCLCLLSAFNFCIRFFSALNSSSSLIISRNLLRDTSVNFGRQQMCRQHVGTYFFLLTLTVTTASESESLTHHVFFPVFHSTRDHY
jgi:hypothetical protein